MKNKSMFDEEDCRKDNKPRMAPMRDILPQKYHREVLSEVLDLEFNICTKKCPIKEIDDAIYIFCDNRDFVIILNPSQDVALKYEIFAWNEERTHYQGSGMIYYKNGEVLRFDSGGDKNQYEDL